MGELDGKVAVITGAGSGMGRACSNVFVREGARVLAADISGREEETAAELEQTLSPLRDRCDFTIAYRLDYRDGEGRARPLAILVRG
jgi:NAD(P)-dependent dehydrogenase (short-subunit alcohol dehydrogenase family)